MDDNGLGLMCLIVGDVNDVSSLEPICCCGGKVFPKSRGEATTAGRRGGLEKVGLGDALCCVNDTTGADVVRFS